MKWLVHTLLEVIGKIIKRLYKVILFQCQKNIQKKTVYNAEKVVQWCLCSWIKSITTCLLFISFAFQLHPLILLFQLMIIKQQHIVKIHKLCSNSFRRLLRLIILEARSEAELGTALLGVQATSEHALCPLWPVYTVCTLTYGKKKVC